MKKIFYICIIVIVTCVTVSCRKDINSTETGQGADRIEIPDKEGMTVKGIVINSVTKEPIEGIIISDGRLFTTTAEDGIYYLPTDLSTQRCVFAILPSEYEVPVNGSNCFNAWKPIMGSKDVYTLNFSLTPRESACDNYQVLFVGDPQIKTNDNSIQSYDYVIEGVTKYAASANVPVYAVNLGDIVWDDMSLFGTAKRSIARAGVAHFNVPGNHDHYQSAANEYDAIADYIKAFGPNNYSVNIGKIHYIFLDTVAWAMDETNKDKYASGLDEEALTFLENDLKYVSKDTPLHICCHTSMSKTNEIWSTNRYNFERFDDLIAGYDVQIWYGHYHINYMYSYTDADLSSGKSKAKSMESHMIVRCTGTLKMNGELSPDGIPRGFVVADVKGKDVTWKYEAVAEYENEQLFVYTPAETGENYLYANVFLYDNKWGKVEWWENGVKVCDMEAIVGIDPMYAKLYRENGNIGMVPADTDNSHLFRCIPSPGVTSGEVRITDRFGNLYTQEVSL